MTISNYRKAFSKSHQGELTCCTILSEPVYRPQDPVISKDDSDKLSMLVAKVAKKQPSSIAFTGEFSADKATVLNSLSRKLSLSVCYLNCQHLVENYIGETEKNICQLIADAESKHWILFFDEADALFAKPSDVSDSDDSYVNQQPSYLLHRLSRYSGLSVLSFCDETDTRPHRNGLEHLICFR